MEYWPILLDCHLFKDMDYMEIEAFLQFVGATECPLEKGEIMWPNQSECQHILVILKGAMKVNGIVVKSNSDSMVERLYPGDMFGTAFAVLGQTVLGHIQATCHTTILSIPVSCFLSQGNTLCPSYGIVSRNLIHVLAEKAHENALRLRYLRYRTLKKMLAAYLLDNSPSENGVAFSLPLNKSMLASFMGVSRPAMARVLASMQEEGLISYQLNSYKILDLQGLSRLLT